jgi:hypothetical protein
VVIAVVERPHRGKIRVRLPYTGKSNRTLIEDLLPGGAHVERLPGNTVWWEVDRNKLTLLVQGLADHPDIDDVQLNLYQSGTGGCVAACYLGSDSDEAILMCECSCVGLNHGSGHPPDGSRLVGISVNVGEVYRYPGGIRRVMYSQLRSEF